MSSTSPKKSSPPKRGVSFDEKAAALRANLQRRKQQAKATKTQQNQDRKG